MSCFFSFFQTTVLNKLVDMFNQKLTILSYLPHLIPIIFKLGSVSKTMNVILRQHLKILH